MRKSFLVEFLIGRFFRLECSWSLINMKFANVGFLYLPQIISSNNKAEPELMIRASSGNDHERKKRKRKNTFCKEKVKLLCHQK